MNPDQSSDHTDRDSTKSSETVVRRIEQTDQSSPELSRRPELHESLRHGEKSQIEKTRAKKQRYRQRITRGNGEPADSHAPKDRADRRIACIGPQEPGAFQQNATDHGACGIGAKQHAVSPILFFVTEVVGNWAPGDGQKVTAPPRRIMERIVGFAAVSRIN